MTILDLSKWQGTVSQSAFGNIRTTGVGRVIHKLGGSNAGTYVDSKYVANTTAARAAGLPLGHYWFNGSGDPTVDANFFVDHLANYQPGDWLIIDTESYGPTMWNPTQVLAFAREVKQLTGVTVIVYMSASVTRQFDWTPVVVYGCPLWVAAYQGAAPTVAYWKTWAAWQYTSSGTVPGIPGNVDLSHEGTAPTAPNVPALEGTMTDYSLVRKTGDPNIYLSTDRQFRRHIPSPAALADVLYVLNGAGGNAAACANRPVDVVNDLDAYGIDVTGLDGLTAAPSTGNASVDVAALAQQVAPLVATALTSSLPAAIATTFATRLES